MVFGNSQRSRGSNCFIREVGCFAIPSDLFLPLLHSVNLEQKRGDIPSRVTFRVADELDTLEQKFGNVWKSCADSHFSYNNGEVGVESTKLGDVMRRR